MAAKKSSRGRKKTKHKVKSHTRKLSSGKTTRVKAHRRKNRSAKVGY